MSKDNMNSLSLKELEIFTWRRAQEQARLEFTQTLEELDKQLAETRDKKRFYYHDKRSLQMETFFGFIEVERIYYKDTYTGNYVFLLDQALQFEGANGFSPLVEESALELAAKGPSYRKAVDALEQFLGYKVMSHETLRQRMLEAEVLPISEKRPSRRVLYVEVDGLFTKFQRSNQSGKEIKIAGVFEQWAVNGKRVSLQGKRHYVHKDKNRSFWEGFESFLEENYQYDPLETLLVINGDGAPWITACQEYFGKRAFYSLDRFHVAKELRSLFRDHKRYRAMRKALASYDPDQFLLELNSAVGTLKDEVKEEKLIDWIEFLTKHKQALTDYRKWLISKNIETTGMRPMGSAEGMMNTFAKRLKNGRAWSEKGVMAVTNVLIGLRDNLDIKSTLGIWMKHHGDQNKPVYQKRQPSSLTRKKINESTRNNLPYLLQPAGKPIVQALKAISYGF